MGISRGRQVAIGEGLLVASIVSIVFRTRFGVGPATGTLPPLAMITTLVAAPSLILIAVTRNWRIWPFMCALSAPWLFIGLMGDTSCVDCGFVFLIPLALIPVQLALLGAALLFPLLRRPRPPEHPREDSNLRPSA